MLLPGTIFAQPKTIVKDSSVPGKVLIIAGDYQRSALHNTLFGKNYRKEWATPLWAPIISLDTIYGGLTPYQSGGGRQSKSLRLRDTAKREYVLRSVDKSFGRALPEIARNTFIESAINDQVTFDHPYAALTIAAMADAAGILHTTPKMVYVPQQDALDTFNARFGNYLYMLEQRPDENWETAGNFGNARNIIGTDKLLEKLLKSNDNLVDQHLYARSRLFDMLIGDWGRHEDQWRWGVFEENGKKIYKPIPRDRDHAYSHFGGVFPILFIHAANLDYLRSFDHDIKGIKIYGYTARHLDRQCTNKLTLQDWLSIAAQMEASLTNEVIQRAVGQLPPEVYAISGDDLVARLRSRRDHLRDFASRYYTFIARHVDIPGTEGREYFDVERISSKETRVSIYKIDERGKTNETPIYDRVFKTNETKDIRLYGIAGNDKFRVTGNVYKGINVRIIGGVDPDTIIDKSHVAGWKKRTNIYDDNANNFSTASEARLHLAADSANNSYNYKEFEYPRKGIRPLLSYNNPDKLFASIGYGFAHHAWRKDPYGSQQAIYLRYSITENSWSLLYDATLYKFIGKWDLGISASYDAFRSTNFYGLGNETLFPATNNNYNKLQTKEFMGKLSMNRNIAHHYISLQAYARAIQLINASPTFISDNYLTGHPELLGVQKFVGISAGYTYQNMDDLAIPTKGVMLYGGISYNRNIELPRDFTGINAIAQVYLPLFGKFSLSTRAGVNSVLGKPEFYQYASIGGNQNFRGYKRDRFWGNTALYNSNELRYITDIRSYLMNGKGGLVAYIDDGRVWLNGEQSDMWHYAYGGGILLAPFNKLTFTITYGTSADGNYVNIRFNKLLN
ncbi:MAG: hypothetical protein K0Q79_2291 [Flavipsychrobacter sp.]|jgi:hypothetical protein|nr:hypothetical protein [Flavipsychrobacter sp.]